MRPTVDWEMIPIAEEGTPAESSATEFLRRPSRQSPDAFGPPTDPSNLDPETPEVGP